MTNTLTVVFGLPGVGKTTIAEDIADEQDAVHLDTDKIRKQLHDDPEYTFSETRDTYEEMFDRAETCLSGHYATDVVLDGTFSDAADRLQAEHIAAQHDADIDFIEVVCPTNVVRERLEAAGEREHSDADMSVHYEVRESFDPVDRFTILLNTAREDIEDDE